MFADDTAKGEAEEGEVKRDENRADCKDEGKVSEGMGEGENQGKMALMNLWTVFKIVLILQDIFFLFLENTCFYLCMQVFAGPDLDI